MQGDLKRLSETWNPELSPLFAVGMPKRQALLFLLVLFLVAGNLWHCGGGPSGPGIPETQPPSNLTGRLLFTAFPDFGEGPFVYVMNADGSAETQIVSRGFNFWAGWSPNGSQIAVERRGLGFTSDGLYVMNPDGSGETLITQEACGQLDWSPDGSRFVCTQTSAGSSPLFIVNADGSDYRRITSEANLFIRPDWSPDGTMFAVAMVDFIDSQQATVDIVLLTLEGEVVANLTNSPGIEESNPAWSPDGRRIAFTRSTENGFNVFVMNADGSGQTQLTSGPGRVLDRFPTWAPDGTKIAFYRLLTSRTPSDAAIFIMNADGSQQGTVWKADRLGNRLAGSLDWR
jgi:tricorn protease-like protein